MKLLWILFQILFNLAFKLLMIVAALYLIIAVIMGIGWILFETIAGWILLGVTVLVAVVMFAGVAADSERQ